jgi:hypothetical protein
VTLDQTGQFIKMYKSLDLMADRIDRAILRSMIYTCAELENYTKEFGARFEDDTTATRESIVAFVEGYDTTGKEQRSIDTAEAIRPGSGLRTIESREDDIEGTGFTIILTAGTYYTEYLETSFGGQYAFLNPTMNSFSGTIAHRTFRAIQRVLTRAGLDPLAE